MKDIEPLIGKTPAAALWKSFGYEERHGIVMPLFALRSKKSAGIGEYLDLLPVIDWMAEIGLTILQLLPLNDTGNDPSPYNALSSCALHPIYLSLKELPLLPKFPSLQEKLSLFDLFNKPQRIPYRDVLAAKKNFLLEYYKMAFSSFENTESYQLFLTKHEGWLKPYTLFKSLKDSYANNVWTSWPEEVQSPSNTLLRKFEVDAKTSMDYHAFIQYLCWMQMRRVKEYATKKRVKLEGDIPILISPDSADVWINRHAFDLELAAGAPPDVFNEEGQYWGFPLYKWDIMREDKYAWWNKRLATASEYYDIYRIDHIIGFFRIWAIPRGQKATRGIFLPPSDELVIYQGKSVLETMLSSTQMLPIGEDLGILPDNIFQALRDLGICGTKIIRWEKDRRTGTIYTPYSEYYPISMTSVSTHDSETLQLWWQKYPKEALAFSKFKGWDYQPTLSPERHYDILWDSHHTASIFHINLLQEYFALFPDLCWPNLEDERINLPGFILDANWTYRYKPWIEEFTAHEGLKNTLKKLIS